MTEAKDNIRVQRLVLGVGVVLFVIKVVAWYLTNSVSILTDALESTVNVLTATLGLYSLILAAKPKDANHPYGHGKVEFLSSAIEGTLIGVAGLLIVWESVDRLIHPHPIGRLDIGILLVAIAGAVNAAIGLAALRTGKRNKSLALESSGHHLLSDAWSTLGLLVGLGLVFLFDKTWIDALVAMLFGCIILFTGYRILRRSVAGMMDEADDALLHELITYLQSIRGENWIDLHNLRIIKYGSVLHIDCHLTVPWYFQVREAHTEVDALETAVRNKFGERVELFVHTDACRPSACAICLKSPCEERKEPFRGRVPWSLENSVSAERHSGQSLEN